MLVAIDDSSAAERSSKDGSYIQVEAALRAVAFGKEPLVDQINWLISVCAASISVCTSDAERIPALMNAWT